MERGSPQRIRSRPSWKIKYGIDFDTFYPDSIGEDSKTTVLALYRNLKEKGDKQAVESFKHLHQRHSEVNYVVFGTEDNPDIPEFVEFHKDPSQKSIRELYSQADVFVYPSWVERYGMPPIEAMACKTAVVSTDVDAVREYSPENYVKFLPARKAGPLVAAVEMLLDNPKRIEEMKQSATSTSSSSHEKTAIDQFEDFLTDP
jgi:glycosyltransferase involved in cell wall biosynthesis